MYFSKIIKWIKQELREKRGRPFYAAPHKPNSDEIYIT